MNFLIDENVHIGLLLFLKNLGYDVKTSEKGIRNGQIFSLCTNEKRILITRDADFMNSSIYPKTKHYGIILIRIPSENLEE